jgi:hypothetical protein
LVCVGLWLGALKIEVGKMGRSEDGRSTDEGRGKMDEKERGKAQGLKAGQDDMNKGN